MVGIGRLKAGLGWEDWAEYPILHYQYFYPRYDFHCPEPFLFVRKAGSVPWQIPLFPCPFTSGRFFLSTMAPPMWPGGWILRKVNFARPSIINGMNGWSGIVRCRI